MTETSQPAATTIDQVRPCWDDYFLSIAFAVSSRADCSRRRVGCVITRDNRIVATGYNGAPSGRPGCLTDNACPRANSDAPAFSAYDNCIALHAEQNAVAHASYDMTRGATSYCTDEPCSWCRKTLQSAGVARAVWPAGELLLT